MRRHRRGGTVIAGTLQKPNEFIGILEAAAPQPFLKSHPAGQFPFEKVTPRVTFSAKKLHRGQHFLEDASPSAQPHRYRRNPACVELKQAN